MEVLVALAILSLVLVALNTTLITSLRQTSVSGARTQAVQILNYVGRRIVGGETSLLPPSYLTYDYGTLRQVFPDLPREVHFANPDLYRVSIENLGTPSWASNLGVAVNEYRIQVCWRQAGKEHCTEALTYASSPLSGTPSAPLLPGIN
ncbi:prepilin-type cleavage/methylation domain-containing protein [Thermus sp. PS18]|uniref:type IV pilus modification PilV family protein n=1 Tax=Thermus sp. PS18 TaxID=2849039 RepID=UPI0022644F27|nr:prepilin-type cleavage/methylation domain-containing protein [Thermus sp. PS18]UZX16739.1 prepilin-type cleavage/methylation domain-containing protein [Thermus sp. PS18]